MNPFSKQPPPAVPITLQMGAGHTYELATPAALEAFFATVSYRLEPDGWATRFPVILDVLNAGGLRPADAPAAVAELDVIARELRGLPARKAVWDYQDTRPVPDDGHLPVRHGAASLHEYFVTADGRTPLADRLRETAEAARLRDTTVRMGTVRARQDLRKSLGTFLFGFVLGTAALIWFPDYFLTGHGSKEGPLIWAMGYLMAGFGVWLLIEARNPALAAWRRRHRILVNLAAVSVSAAVVTLSWRREVPPPRPTLRAPRPVVSPSR